MELLELILADRVRELAKEFRKEAYQAAADEAGDDWQAAMEIWEVDNPRSDFIRDAYLELRGVAVQIRTLMAIG